MHFQMANNQMVDSKHHFMFGNQTFMELNKNIDGLRGQTQEIMRRIRELDSEQESFSLKYYEFQKVNGNWVFIFSYLPPSLPPSPPR